MVTRKRIQGETLLIAVLPRGRGVVTVYGVFKGPSGSPISVDAVVTGTVIGTPWVIGANGWTDYGFITPIRSVFTITQDSSAFPVGQWGLEIWEVDVAGNKDVLTTVSFEVVASVANGGSNDVRSRAAKAVESIEAYLADPTNSAAASYKIKDRELSRYSIAELRNLLGFWKTRLREENIKARGRRGLIGRRINVFF
jgi:hypothetical protein